MPVTSSPRADIFLRGGAEFSIAMPFNLMQLLKYYSFSSNKYVFF